MLNGNLMLPAGHILDLHYFRLMYAAPLYEMHYFDAKHLEKGLNRGRVE